MNNKYHLQDFSDVYVIIIIIISIINIIIITIVLLLIIIFIIIIIIIISSSSSSSSMYWGSSWGRRDVFQSILCQNGRMSQEKQRNGLHIYLKSGVIVYPQTRIHNSVGPVWSRVGK